MLSGGIYTISFPGHCLSLIQIGLKVLYKVFPEGMVTCQVPKTCYPSPPPSARKSLKTPPVKSPPPTAIPPSTPHKEYFTPDGEHYYMNDLYLLAIDLDSIQAKLDDALLSSDGMHCECIIY